MQNDIETHCRGVSQAIAELPYTQLSEVARTLLECHDRGGTVFIAGNGGSAATASHFACDLAKGTRHQALPRFRVMALTDNIPLMTAWANDSSYEQIFAEQLEPLVRPGDVLVLISASGNSPNILAADEVARQAGATTIALAGRSGGRISQLADLSICVPADTMEEVEDGHMIICHALCVALRGALWETAAS